MAECHDATSPEEGIDLTSYASIMQGRKRVVTAGDPSRSKLYTSLVTGDRDERMPPPPRSLTAAQIAVISRWIREGASNRDCSNEYTRCDTANATYSAHIQLIMQRACTGCHSGVSPSGGVDLSVRANVVAQARDGFLLGTMSHSPSYAPMPPSGPKVSDCDLAMVRHWIARGMP